MATFADVDPGNQFYREIEWMAAAGISTGYEEGGRRLYRPLDPVRRDAMAAFLHRLAGAPSYPAPLTSPFVDVPVGAQFCAEICWLADQGISTGYADATYRPLEPVTREAMAALMYRFARSPWIAPPDRSPFQDVPTSAQFYPEICWLAGRGISSGWPDGTFRPGLTVARDAMAAFMHRLRSLPPGTDRAAVRFEDATDWNLSAGMGYPYAVIRSETHLDRGGSTFADSIAATLLGTQAWAWSDHPVPLDARRLEATVAQDSRAGGAVRFEVIDAVSGAVRATAQAAPGTSARITADVAGLRTARLRATAPEGGASDARWVAWGDPVFVR